MQVSKVDDRITHVVIGGGDVINFGVSDSAEFLHMLSSTLYSDQILAVVREVICNAWDAHIESGRTHRPIEITLTHEKLTIRDFGTGIAPEMMGPIYAVYGKSTKKNDGLQTGGFGLGCKAPFAYTDHFEVNSYHAGKRTIYAMSKSSAQVGGKPGITQIAQFPTTESGLEVSLNIKKNSDFYRYEELIKMIVSNGEIKAHFNNKPLAVIPFSEAKLGFLVSYKKISTNGNLGSPLYIRYGNVIYPLPYDEKIGAAHSAVLRIIESMPEYNTSAKLILQAPPHSIAVTPSRESISMVDVTINTVIGLLDNFYKIVNKDLQGTFKKILVDTVDTYIADGKIAKLLEKQTCAKGFDTVQMPEYAANISDLANIYMARNYPTMPKFQEFDLETRIYKMIGAGVNNKGFLQTYKHALLRNNEKDHGKWFQRRVVAPMVAAIQTIPQHASVANLCIWGKNGNDWNDKGVTPVLEYKLPSIKYGLLFWKSVVFLAFKDDIEAWRGNILMDRHNLGDVTGTFVYKVTRSHTRVNAMRQLLSSLPNMLFIDLTIANPGENITVKGIPDRTGVEKKNGLVTLASAVSEGGTYVTIYSALDFKKADLIKKPLFVVSPEKHEQKSIGIYTDVAFRLLIDLFGKNAGICRTDRQMESYIKKGALSLDDFVMAYIETAFENNPNIGVFFENQLSRITFATNVNFLRMIQSNKVLNDVFGLPTLVFTKEEDLAIKLWDSIQVGHYRHQLTMTKRIAELKAAIDSLPVNPKLLELANKAANSRLVNLLAFNEVRTMLKSSNKADMGKVPQIVQMVVTALNG